MKRNRLVYFLVCCLLIPLAFASRRYGHQLPRFIVLYAGDTLWAMMVFFALGCLFPRWSANRLFVVVLLFCYAGETSQLYHAPWIDAIRDTWLGGVILGYGFLWSDIVCYTVGVSVGSLFERLAIRVKSRH